MNKELLQQKAEAYGNLHSYPSTAKIGFLAGTNDVINNPELYDLVKGDKYEDLERILSNNEKVVDAANRIIERLKQENKELKDKVTELEGVIAKLSSKILNESNY